MASDSKDVKKEKERKQNKLSQPSLNMNELRELADLVDEHGFTDFEFENEKIRVRLSKNLISANVPQVVQPIAQVQQPTATASSDTGQTAKTQAESSSDNVVDSDDGLHKITSPIVGTFYRSPAPDKPPYAKEGDVVAPDTVVCIVEAMKLMNEIQAEEAGEIVKIYVEDAQPVEFGQPLFGIKK